MRHRRTVKIDWVEVIFSVLAAVSFVGVCYLGAVVAIAILERM